MNSDQKNAMAFHHNDGFMATLRLAEMFAGPDGHIATLPDIVSARLITKPGDNTWEDYYITMTAEYIGKSKTGKMIVIINHGNQPMASNLRSNLNKAWQTRYSHKDIVGGCISQEEFFKLEAGGYGDVTIIDWKDYWIKYGHQFSKILRTSEALANPLLKARLGPRAEEYILAVDKYAKEWHGEQAELYPVNLDGIAFENHLEYVTDRRQKHLNHSDQNSDPYIIDFDHDNKLIRQIKNNDRFYFSANLIKIGELCTYLHPDCESLIHSIRPFDWWHGVKLVGVKNQDELNNGIHPGPNARILIENHWQKLLAPVSNPSLNNLPFCKLMKLNDQWVTQRIKKGKSLDTYQPEFIVNSITKINEPVLFKTKISGHYGVVRYGLDEIESIAPPEANAYDVVGDWKIEYLKGEPDKHVAMIQFYKIEADTTKRIMKGKTLSYDFKKMMELLNY